MKLKLGLLVMALLIIPSVFAASAEQMTLGHEDAPVTIDYYINYQSTTDSRWYINVLPSIKKNLIDSGKVRMEFHHFPLTNNHPHAVNTAVAAECAAQQGTYFEFLDKVFHNQDGLSLISLRDYAERVDLDLQQFDSCMLHIDSGSAVQVDMNDGNALGVVQTPTFFFNGIKVEGEQPYHYVKTKVNGLLDAVSGITQRVGSVVTQLPSVPSAIPESASADEGAVEEGGTVWKAIGNPKAPVTIEEYVDLECPFCKRFHDTTYQEIKENFIDTGEVYFVWKHFPLDTIHVNAMNAAVASECAARQGQYNTFIDVVFDNADNLGLQALDEYAQKIGLDMSTYRGCMLSIDSGEAVQAEQAQGMRRGVSGTPAFFVNGKKIVGAQPYSVFKDAILDAGARSVVREGFTAKATSAPSFGACAARDILSAGSNTLYVVDDVEYEVTVDNLRTSLGTPVAVLSVNGEVITFEVGHTEILQDGRLMRVNEIVYEDSSDGKKVVEICLSGEKTQIVQKDRQKDTPTHNQVIPSVVDSQTCDGCSREGKCLPYGTRIVDDSPLYCGLNGDFVKQQEIGAQCQNNYECTTNSCASGECINLVDQIQENRNLVEGIVQWLSKFFGFRA